MDNGKRLYDQLSKDKLYTKSYDEFVNQFGSPDGQKRLYNTLKEQNLYTKSEQEFVGQFWSKKKDQTQGMVSATPSETTKPSSVSKGQIVTGPSASFGQSGSKLLAQEPTKQELPSTEGELLRAPEKPKPYNLKDKSWLENKQDVNALSKGVIEKSKLVASDIKAFNADSKSFQDDLNSFQQLAELNPSDPQLITLQKDLQKRQEELNQRSQALNNQASEVDVANLELKKKAVANYKKKAEQGNWGGALWNSIINGLESSAQGFQRSTIDAGIELLDLMGIDYASKEKKAELRNQVIKEGKGKLTEEEINSKVKDLSKKEVINTFKPILKKGYEEVKSKGTTEEFIQEKKKEGILPLATLGIAESLPIMASGGYGRFATGAMQTYASLNEQMDNDPALASMDENERKKITLPIAIISGYLEDVSFGRLLKQGAPALTPVVGKFVSAVLSKIPANATMDLIGKATKEFAESTAGKLLLKTAESAAKSYGVEAETGALQSSAEMITKEIYDKANNIDLFKNPEILSKEFLGKVIYDANVEGIGGLIMGAPIMAAQSALKGKDLSNDDFVAMKSLIQDPENAQLTISKITTDLSTGVITKEDAENQLKALNESKRILDLIPDQIPVESQRKAFTILADNAKIESELEQMSESIVGKDPNLVTDVTASMKEKEAQIEKNNQELSKLPKNAIQEQTTSEVPVQPETGVSGEVEEGEPQSEPQVPTEEVKVEEVAQPTEMSQEEWTKVQELADRIYNGEEITAAEDLQMQQKYPKAIESLLSKKQEPTETPKATKLSDEQNSAIKNGIKKAEDLVKAFPKRQPLAVKEKAITEFQKTNQEYIDADQTQKEEMIRQMNYSLGTAKKVSPPSVKKVLGIKPTMILVDEMKSLQEKLKLQEKAAKSGMDFANKAKKLVNLTLKKLPKGALDTKAINSLLTALDGKAETAEQRSVIIGKVLDIFKKSEDKVAISNAKLVSSQIEAEIRGAKKGVDFVKRITKSLSETLKSMVSRGAITPFQQSAIFNGLKSNLANPAMLDKFIAKVQQIIEKADYAKDLFDANKLKGRISSIAKRKNLSPEDKNIAKGFTSINPDLVTNLPEYINKATAFIESVSAPKVVEGKTVKPKVINYKEFNDYLNKQATIQQKALDDAMSAKYDKLLEEGKVTSNMNVADIEDYLKGVQENPKSFDYPKSVQVLKDSREFFEDSKKEVLEMIKNGEVNKEDLPLIKKFIDMNLLRMSSMDAFKAAKSLENFIVNGSTANMGLILDTYTGALKADQMLKLLEYKKRVVDKKIKLGGYKKYVYALGDIPYYLSNKKVKKLSDVYQENWLKELGHIDNFGSTYFGKPWEDIKEAMGYDRIEQGAVQTKQAVIDFSNKIEEKYKDRKNGEHNFLTSYTANELAMVGILYREATNMDTKQYFDERKKNIKETIEYLEEQEENKDLAERLRDIYEKLDIENATSGKEVFDRANPVIREALNDYISEYQKWYPEFARIAKEQFGIILSPDANYLPDFWEKTVDYDPEADVFSTRGFSIGHDIVNTKPAGNFIAPKYPDGLPRNADGSVNKIINFDFFQNNNRALTSTIGNVKTAPGMNQYLGFVNSPAFRYIIKNKYSRDLFKDKMDYTIRSLTNNAKTPKSGAIFDFLAPLYSYLGKAGARLGLSSVFAASKQTLPLFLNTLTYLNKNSGKMLEAMKIINDPKVMEWMNKMPYTVSVRSKESVTSIDFASKLLDKGDYSTKDKAAKSIKSALDFIIDKRLVPADVYIARTSWLAIYLNELQKLGVKDFDFDGYDSPESIKAAKEAERIVKKEHNQSMSELLPRLYSGKDSARKFARMAFGPFSGYSMAMKDKIKANSAILFDTNFKATKEEKADAAKSMVATLIEQTMFNGLRWGIGAFFIGVANYIDNEEEDEDTKTLKAMQEAQRMGTSTLQSFTGSLPFVEEEAEQYAINGLLDLVDYLHAYITNKEDGKMSPEQEAAWKKFESGGEESMPETYEEKQRKKTKEKINKPLRIFIPETEGKFDAMMSLMGGTTAVSYEVGKKVIFDNFMELYKGGYTDKYDKFHPYTEEEKQKILNRMYLAPGEITVFPTEYRSIQNKRKKNFIKNVLKREDYDKKMEAEFNKTN
jgi:hypothetical protein